MLRGRYNEDQVIHSIAELRRHRARLEEIRDSRIQSAGWLPVSDLRKINSEIQCIHGVEAHLQALLPAKQAHLLH